MKSKWFGDPERNVHRLFRDARRAAPCVLVFDDADNLMPDRSNLQGSVASTEQSVVNAFLQELEGFEEDSSGILVILTTNRYASLDPALRQRLGDPIRIPYVLSRKQIEALLEVLSGEEELDRKSVV